MPMRSLLTIATLVLLAAVPAAAHDTGHSTPVILAPANGATVSNPVIVVIGLKDSRKAEHHEPAAGSAKMEEEHHHHGGHAHLVVDAPLPKAGTAVPVDDNHIHVVDGGPKVTLTLPPGRHTLQAIMAGEDHVVPPHAAHSRKITITVK